MSERISGNFEDALYKSTYTLLTTLLSVSLLVTFVNSAKTAEPIEMRRFGALTRVDRRNQVLNRGRNHHMEMGNFGGLSSQLKCTGNFCWGLRSKRDNSIVNHCMQQKGSFNIN